MRQLAAEILDRARTEGFADAGICRPEVVRDAGLRLKRWVELGYAGTMDWMADRLDWRQDPTRLWPAARSVIMLAENYGPDEDPLATLSDRQAGTISVYARGRDYHDVVKKRLKRLGRWLVSREPCEIKVFVDTAPVMEKPLGQAAGLGWQGKHTNLVSRRLGSWFFLGAIFTTLELPESGAEVDHCGRCRRCLDACPTGAFPKPYLLDARRCISYLTIEHKGPVDPALRPALGNRIYGCDDCLAVCPWNKFAQTATEMRYHARPGTAAPRLDELAALDDRAFRARFSGSPIKRIGRNRFVRNVAYAIGNSGDAALRPSAQRLAADSDPVVTDAGAWALERLGSKP